LSHSASSPALFLLLFCGLEIFLNKMCMAIWGGIKARWRSGCEHRLRLASRWELLQLGGGGRGPSISFPAPVYCIYKFFYNKT
jgi:hypothetical protein